MSFRKNDFAELSKNLARCRSKNNFGLSKLLCKRLNDIMNDM